mmetsp:Transcript_14981/g.24867  ORF Transcript_14981/g.24867 Transcript_14981/m.24867 type:complete len:160 (-) Transcript_14981:4079-4558(-)
MPHISQLSPAIHPFLQATKNKSYSKPYVCNFIFIIKRVTRQAKLQQPVNPTKGPLSLTGMTPALSMKFAELCPHRQKKKKAQAVINISHAEHLFFASSCISRRRRYHSLHLSLMGKDRLILCRGGRLLRGHAQLSLDQLLKLIASDFALLQKVLEGHVL